VLLAASTNFAVDNVLEWQEQLPTEEQQFVLPVRIGYSERISSDAIEPFLQANFERSVREDTRTSSVTDASSGRPPARVARCWPRA
jgi:hypothetical protein